MRKFLVIFIEFLEIAIVAVFGVFLIRTYIVQPFLVWGSSMAPNFVSGDYVLTDELSPRLNGYSRGEIIVLRYPKDPSTYFIKRIIGLPNEKVVIEGNKITIFNKENPNGFVLNENYLVNMPKTFERPNKSNVFELKDDEYFVMGDNREYSFDSRDWGPLKKDYIIGIARIRLWPLNSIKVFAAPSY
jgi:signal peptidase I